MEWEQIESELMTPEMEQFFTDIKKNRWMGNEVVWLSLKG